MIELQKNIYPGILIVFEGIDGAGKTSLIEKTFKFLCGNFDKRKILIEKQPTDLSRGSRLFKKMMYCENNSEISYRALQLLTLSDRIQHNHEVIVPALKEGKIVICDRYLYTSIANMFARGYRFEDWFFQACREIIRPDIAFLANAKPELAIKRIRMRPSESQRYLNERLLKDVAKEFLNIKDEAEFYVLDTNKEIDISFKAVKSKILNFLGDKNE